MDTKWEPGQRVVIRKGDDCIMGKVVSHDEEYTVVQFEELDEPTVLNEAALQALELCEDYEEDEDE